MYVSRHQVSIIKILLLLSKIGLISVPNQQYLCCCHLSGTAVLLLKYLNRGLFCYNLLLNFGLE